MDTWQALAGSPGSIVAPTVVPLSEAGSVWITWAAASASLAGAGGGAGVCVVVVVVDVSSPKASVASTPARTTVSTAASARVAAPAAGHPRKRTRRDIIRANIELYYAARTAISSICAHRARPPIPSRCDVLTRMLGPARPRPRRCPGADGGRGTRGEPRGLRWERRELLLILLPAGHLGEQRHGVRRRGAPRRAPPPRTSR